MIKKELLPGRKVVGEKVKVGKTIDRELHLGPDNQLRPVDVTKPLADELRAAVGSWLRDMGPDNVKRRVHRVLTAAFDDMLLGVLGVEPDSFNRGRYKIVSGGRAAGYLTAYAVEHAAAYMKERLEKLNTEIAPAKLAGPSGETLQQEYNETFRRSAMRVLYERAEQDANAYVEKHAGEFFASLQSASTPDEWLVEAAPDIAVEIALTSRDGNGETK